VSSAIPHSAGWALTGPGPTPRGCIHAHAPRAADVATPHIRQSSSYRCLETVRLVITSSHDTKLARYQARTIPSSHDTKLARYQIRRSGGVWITAS